MTLSYSKPNPIETTFARFSRACHPRFHIFPRLAPAVPYFPALGTCGSLFSRAWRPLYVFAFSSQVIHLTELKYAIFEVGHPVISSKTPSQSQSANYHITFHIFIHSFFKVQQKLSRFQIDVVLVLKDRICVFFSVTSTPTTPRERSFLPTIEVCKAGEEGSEEDPFSWRTSDYYRSMTSLVLERSSRNPQSWVWS